MIFDDEKWTGPLKVGTNPKPRTLMELLKVEDLIEKHDENVLHCYWYGIILPTEIVEKINNYFEGEEI